MNKVKATGVPFMGHGGSLAQACNIRKHKLPLDAHGGHSTSTRWGASRIEPSLICGKINLRSF